MTGHNSLNGAGWLLAPEERRRQLRLVDDTNWVEVLREDAPPADTEWPDRTRKVVAHGIAEASFERLDCWSAPTIAVVFLGLGAVAWAVLAGLAWMIYSLF